MEAFIDKIIELTREITILRLENKSHNIATIKYKCREMLQFYNKYKV